MARNRLTETLVGACDDRGSAGEIHADAIPSFRLSHPLKTLACASG
jgi:hypothetical protein